MGNKTMKAIAPAGSAQAVMKGMLSSVGIMIMGSVLMSGLIVRELVRENAIGYVAMGILLVSSVAGSLVAIRKIQRRKVLVAAVTGAGYLLLLLSANALLYKGGYEGVGVTTALVMGGSIAASLIWNPTRNRTHPSKRKKRHR